jgi:hypothetical protein
MSAAQSNVAFLNEVGHRRKKSSVISNWYGFSREGVGIEAAKTRFPYETAIRVDNPFVAAGVAGQGFSNIPVVASGIWYGGSEFEIAGTSLFQTNVPPAPQFAMLDEQNRVLIIRTHADEWNLDWSSADYTRRRHRYLTGYEDDEPAVFTVAPDRVDLLDTEASRQDVALWRIFGAAGIPAGVIVAGGVLLGEGLTGKAVSPNPYVGLALILGGIVLLVTALLASKGNVPRS